MRALVPPIVPVSYLLHVNDAARDVSRIQLSHPKRMPPNATKSPMMMAGAAEPGTSCGFLIINPMMKVYRVPVSVEQLGPRMEWKITTREQETKRVPAVDEKSAEADRKGRSIWTMLIWTPPLQVQGLDQLGHCSASALN